MAAVPSLPVGGPLRVLAVAATVGLLSFAAALAAALIGKRYREAGWAAAVVGLAAATMVLGAYRLQLLHTAVSLLTLALALRQAWRSEGVARVTSGLGAAGWAVSLVAARYLFG